MIRYLEPSEHVSTRKMWEEIFSSDSKAFLDYYFSEKARANQILVIEEETPEDRNRENSIQAQEVLSSKGRLLSMLQLNPYKMNLREQVVNTNYIVGVATDSNHRHQGHMKNLLIQALKDMFQKRETFTFLMPAAEAIYKPFDFRFIYDQKGCTINKEIARGIINNNSSLLCRSAKQRDITQLVRFSNQILSQRYQVYTHRTQEYYETLAKETACENGEILLFFDNDELSGYCFYGIGEFVEVRELICRKGYEKGYMSSLLQTIIEYNKDIKLIGIDFHLADTLEKLDSCITIKNTPMIMARIVNFESFIVKMKAKSKLNLTIQIRDSFISENNRTFHLFTSEDNSYIQVKNVDEKAEIEFTIGDLTSFLFGYKSLAELEEIGKPITDKLLMKELDKIHVLTKIFLNEVV